MAPNSWDNVCPKCFLELRNWTNSFSLKWEKRNSFSGHPPPVDKIPQNISAGEDVHWGIANSQFTEKLFLQFLSSNKHFGRAISQLFGAKRRSHLVHIWLIGCQFNFKILMGVAGSIFEPHSSNFDNQCLISIYLKDLLTTFCYLSWFQT